jgi:hypothetical protein
MSFMQDPMIMQTIGQSPQAQQVMAALQAHIAEHLGFNYRKQIEERLGVPMIKPNEEIPEEMEVQLSRVVADAARQLTQAHQQQAAQQQAQQQAADPLFQLEQQKVQTQQMEVQRKAKKDQMDAAVDAEKLKLERERVEIETMKEGARLISQGNQANQKAQLEALKTLATPKAQPKPPTK